MSITNNKELVLQFMKNLSDGNVPAMMEAMDDEATWTVMGDRSLLPMAGTNTKAQQKASLEGLKTIAPEGIKIDVTGVTAEGDRVAVEATSDARLANGKTYCNGYHFLFELKNGKIIAAREYCDTLHVQFAFS